MRYRSNLLAVIGSFTLCAPLLAQIQNQIQIENRKPGSTDWQLTRVKVDKASLNFRSPLIEGYCSHQSVQAGDELKIMVSTAPAAKFKIEIFRTGYYQGR